MIKFILLLLSIVSIEATANTKKEDFIIMCEGNYVIAQLALAPRLTHKVISPAAKQACKHVVNLMKKEYWDDLKYPLSEGCYFGTFFFLSSDFFPKTNPNSIGKYSEEACTDLKGR